MISVGKITLPNLQMALSRERIIHSPNCWIDTVMIARRCDQMCAICDPGEIRRFDREIPSGCVFLGAFVTHGNWMLVQKGQPDRMYARERVQERKRVEKNSPRGISVGELLREICMRVFIGPHLVSYCATTVHFMRHARGNVRSTW